MNEQHKHKWVVYSTAVFSAQILVECKACPALGAVGDPTKEEWKAAWSAPSNPYPWTEPERVAVLLEGE